MATPLRAHVQDVSGLKYPALVRSFQRGNKPNIFRQQRALNSPRMTPAPSFRKVAQSAVAAICIAEAALAHQGPRRHVMLADIFDFTFMDTDRDRRLSRAEFGHSARMLFDRVDRDSSGGISRSELRFFRERQKRKPPSSEFERAASWPGFPRDQRAVIRFGPFAEELWNARLAPRDQDADQLISAAEFAGR